MTKSAFDRIAEGLREALAIARGDEEPARVTCLRPEIDFRPRRTRRWASGRVINKSER